MVGVLQRRGPLHFCTEKTRQRGAENRDKSAARPKGKVSGRMGEEARARAEPRPSAYNDNMMKMYYMIRILYFFFLFLKRYI